MTNELIVINEKNVITVAKKICLGNYHCYDEGKISSALHSAFYPGAFPFAHGSIPEIAAAILFYITKAHAFFDGNKRTALISSSLFLRLNNFELEYQIDSDQNLNEAAFIVEECSAGKVTLEELKSWFLKKSRQII